MYLDDEQIVGIITSYIYEHDQAILVDGAWGSGKTYFIKEKLIPELDNKIKATKNKLGQDSLQVAYISLYGISSLNDIKNKIYISFLENLCDRKILKNKITEMVKPISEIISPYVKIGKNIFDFCDRILREYSKNVDYIIIFDDIERCDIDVNQLLGYVNGLVEHSSVKAILVGNEKEFATHKIQQDISNKFNVVLNERIDWQEEIKGKKEECSKELLTKDKITEYAEKLFSMDTGYQKIKEKLIGLTIKYNPEFDKAYSNICKKYAKTDDIRKFLSTRKNYVLDMFKKEKHSNLRTLIFVIISFEKIYQVSISNKNENDIEFIDEIREKILKYIVKLAIRIKTAQTLPKWDNSSEISRIIYLENKGMPKDCIMGYQFVDTYLCNGYFDTEKCQKVINNYLTEEKERRHNQAKNLEISNLNYNKIREWRELEDGEIRELLKNIVSELAETKYPLEYFKEILITLTDLEWNNFEGIPDTEKFTDPMKDYIKNNNVTELKFFNIWTDDNDFNKKYDKLVSPLLEAIQINILGIPKIDYAINDWFKESFSGWCSEERNNFYIMKRFISLVEFEKVIDKIKNSKTKEIYYFINGLEIVYNTDNLNDFFKSDLENINEILSRIDADSFSNKSTTKRIAIEKLKYKLEDVKRILEI